VKATDKQLEKARSPDPRPPDAAGADLPEEQVHAGRRLQHARRGHRPLLWRLDYYGIDLSKNAVPLLKYAERIFSRPAYIEALTPSEKVMRK
jgi:RNA polymerase-associated protein